MFRNEFELDGLATMILNQKLKNVINQSIMLECYTVHKLYMCAVHGASFAFGFFFYIKTSLIFLNCRTAMSIGRLNL